MRQDPGFLLWEVRCHSLEEGDEVRRGLRQTPLPDVTIRDEVRARLDRVESPRYETHRVGDYFEDIRVLDDPDPASLRVLSHRRSNAGRFWKDVMVHVLQAVREAWPAAATLIYRGDEEPSLARSDRS